MRIRIVLDLKDKQISVAYHLHLQAVLYNCLSHNDETSKLHDEGYKLGKRNFKLFTFSEIYGPSKYNSETKKLEFFDNGCFDFTSSDSNVVKEVVDYIGQNKTIQFGDKIIKIIKYDILDDECTYDSTETYYTLSPIVMDIMTIGKTPAHLDVSSEQFKTAIINNLAQKYYLVYNDNLPEIVITAISNVKEKKIWYKKVLYHANHMNITFENLTPQVKYVILTCGLGSKSSMGFGMVAKKNETKTISV